MSRGNAMDLDSSPTHVQDPPYQRLFSMKWVRAMHPIPVKTLGGEGSGD
jgi:hypothetical protein